MSDTFGRDHGRFAVLLLRRRRNTRTQAPTEQRNGKWTAVLDHTGAAGKQVMAKATFPDANGNPAP